MPRVANAPLGTFLAHHHLTPLINKTIRLQKLQSSAYAPSANMMGSNLWSYYVEVAKVWAQNKSPGPGHDASEKWKHWGTPQATALHQEHLLPGLSSGGQGGGGTQKSLSSPWLSVARGPQAAGSRATPNLFPVASCPAVAMTLACLQLSLRQ